MKKELKKIKTKIKYNKITQIFSGAIVSLSVPSAYFGFVRGDSTSGLVFTGIGVFYGYRLYSGIKNLRKNKNKLSELESKLE